MLKIVLSKDSNSKHVVLTTCKLCRSYVTMTNKYANRYQTLHSLVGGAAEYEATLQQGGRGLGKGMFHTPYKSTQFIMTK